MGDRGQFAARGAPMFRKLPQKGPFECKTCMKQDTELDSRVTFHFTINVSHLSVCWCPTHTAGAPLALKYPSSTSVSGHIALSFSSILI